MKCYNFDDDGFVILRGVFSTHEVSEFKNLLEKIIEYASEEYSSTDDPFHRYYLRHRADQGVLYDLFQRHPEFSDVVRNPKILAKLSEVLGEDIILYENSMVYKPKGKKNGVPWHQDFVSRANEPRKFIAWCAFDSVTRETGALKVIPGSHKLGFLPWYTVKGETHHDRIRLDGVNVNGAVHVELEPGDVLIFNQLLVHSSDEMNTDDLRLVFRASYQSFDEIFVPRGAPIVVKGGHPESLKKRFSAPRIINEKSFFVRGINKLGRALANL